MAVLKLRSLLLLLPVVVVGLAAGCSSSSPATATADDAGSCSVLASRCHPIKTPLGTECHELGHEGDDTKCGPRKAECLAECPEKVEDAGGSTPDSGSGAADGSADADKDAGADGGDACPAYCACMKATCAEQPGYPFADDAACLSACAGFSDEDRACYAKSCEAAKTGNKEHECEHASGAIACH